MRILHFGLVINRLAEPEKVKLIFSQVQQKDPAQTAASINFLSRRLFWVDRLSKSFKRIRRVGNQTGIPA